MTEEQAVLRCKSCSMTIESGDFCGYCTDDSGALRGFDETFERFIRFAMGRNPGLTRPEAEASTLAFMATMPAWADHPAVRAATSGRASRAGYSRARDLVLPCVLGEDGGARAAALARVRDASYQ